MPVLAEVAVGEGCRGAAEMQGETTGMTVLLASLSVLYFLLAGVESGVAPCTLTTIQ